MLTVSAKNPRTESTVAELLAWGRKALEQGRGTSEPREAVLLLRAVLDLDEAGLRARPERRVTPGDAKRFAALVRRRAAGEPVAYLRGEREFYGRCFVVDPRVLIPRPETELLVELALAASRHRRPRILDLGTGSGCLAITLAAELDAATVTAVDSSLAALEVAAANRVRHAIVGRVRLLASDWAAALDLAQFDLVVANPPYLSEAEWRASAIDVRGHEPRPALVAGRDGLDAYRDLLLDFGRLRTGCRVLFEVGSGQARRVAELCAPILGDVAIHRDLAGLDRVVIGTRKSG